MMSSSHPCIAWVSFCFGFVLFFFFCIKPSYKYAKLCASAALLIVVVVISIICTCRGKQCPRKYAKLFRISFRGPGIVFFLFASYDMYYYTDILLLVTFIYFLLFQNVYILLLFLGLGVRIITNKL